MQGVGVWIAAGVLGVIGACSASKPSDSRGAGPARPAAGSGAAGATLPVSVPSPTSAGNSDGNLIRTTAPPPQPTAAGSGGSSAPAGNGPISIDQTGGDNPARLPPQDVQALMAGGAPAAGMRLLYPYEGTVFPRGMLAPLLMWDGPAPDAVYVHIKSQTFEYKGVLAPQADQPGPQVVLPQDVWQQAGSQTKGPSDVYTLELTARSAGTVSGPLVLHFNIAQATIKGSIYYNTYSSRLPGAAVGGNVLRIPPGGSAEMFVSTTCNGCHSVSADGSRMLSQVGLAVGGSSFELLAGGTANPAGVPAGPRTSFGALYPDGSKYLSTSVVIEVARAALTQQLGNSTDATLYDSATGQVVPNTGIPVGALMPMFSPSGTKLAFNDYAYDMGRGLALMDYDVATNTASNPRRLTTESDPVRPAWPFFLPDEKGIVFIRTEAADFSGGSAGLLGTSALAPNSDLYVVGVTGGEPVLLAKAMGFNSAADAASGNAYLPFGAEEVHHNYFPTVAPVAGGGYFWVFFDAVRHYGNLGVGRQLWGAAVDIRPDGSYTVDGSHPAFFVPGQEVGTGNHRAFAALDPCRKDGDTCTSGVDCCGGTCIFPEAQENLEPVGKCMPPPLNMCAKREEKCKKDSDCCLPSQGEDPLMCIGGFCTVISLK